jgi:hypothetical protein
MGRRGKQVLLLLVVGLGLAVVVAVSLTWRSVATSGLDDVTIVQGGGHDGLGITCAGDPPRMRRLDGQDRVPVMRAQPGMDCRMPVVVTNEGSRAVRLDAVVMSYMGPSSGMQLQVKKLEGMPRARRLSHGGLDAAFRVNRDLEPGDSYRVTVRFTYRDEGCNDGTIGLRGFPRVLVSSRGLSGEVAGGTVAFHSTGQAQGCPD